MVEIDYTEDGINYETKEIPEPKVNYEFGEEGIRFLDGDTNEEIGKISWLELRQGSGGSAAYPSNVRIETTRDNEIVLGFKDSEEGESAVRVSMINGFPQVFMDNTELQADLITTKTIHLEGESGQKSDAEITSSDFGDLVVSYRSRSTGEIHVVDLGGFLDDQFDTLQIKGDKK